MADSSLGPIFEIFNLLAVVGGGALAIGGAIVISPRVLGLLRQRSYDRATERERRRWLLRLDATAARDPDAAGRLVAALHPGGRRGVSRWASGWPHLELAVTWTGAKARWEIEAPRQLTRAVETAVAAAFPGAELEEIEPRADPGGGLRLGVRGTPPDDDRQGLSDFGALLTELLARLPAGAEAAWTLRVTPLPDDHEEASGDRISMGEMFFDSLLNRQPRHVSASPPRVVRAPRTAFSVTASLEASSVPAPALRAWLFDAVGAVGSLRASGWRIEASVGGRSSPMRLGARELAELWGLSGASADARAVDVVRSRRLPAPLVAPAPGLRPIGLDAGRSVLVPESLFDRHVVLLGRTGSGKSTELVALAADDLRSGRGFTFIDPHGDAVARLLDSVPQDQAHRVHLLELAEKDHPRGFNPIELDGADPEIVAAQFVDTMRDLYFAQLSNPPYRQLQYLRSGLLTMLTAEPTDEPWTLVSLNQLFIDRRFREEVLAGMTDPMVLNFWEHEWPKGRRGVTDPSADALISKLSAFLSYP